MHPLSKDGLRLKPPMRRKLTILIILLILGTLIWISWESFNLGKVWPKEYLVEFEHPNDSKMGGGMIFFPIKLLSFNSGTGVLEAELYCSNPQFHDFDRTFIFSWDNDTKLSSTVDRFVFNEFLNLPAGKTETFDAMHLMLRKHALLRGTGNSFWYPFDSYRFFISMRFWKLNKKNNDIYDHQDIQGGLAYAGYNIENRVRNFKLSKLSFGSHIWDQGKTSILFIEFTRPVFIKILFCFLFLITPIVVCVFILTRERKDEILKGMLGTILAIWSIRNLLQDSSVASQPTLVEVFSLALLLIFCAVSIWKWNKLDIGKKT